MSAGLFVPTKAPLLKWQGARKGWLFKKSINGSLWIERATPARSRALRRKSCSPLLGDGLRLHTMQDFSSPFFCSRYERNHTDSLVKGLTFLTESPQLQRLQNSGKACMASFRKKGSQLLGLESNIQGLPRALHQFRLGCWVPWRPWSNKALRILNVSRTHSRMNWCPYSELSCMGSEQQSSSIEGNPWKRARLEPCQLVIVSLPGDLLHDILKTQIQTMCHSVPPYGPNTWATAGYSRSLGTLHCVDAQPLVHQYALTTRTRSKTKSKKATAADNCCCSLKSCTEAMQIRRAQHKDYSRILSEALRSLHWEGGLPKQSLSRRWPSDLLHRHKGLLLHQAVRGRTCQARQQSGDCEPQ